MRRLMDPDHKQNVPTALELAKMLNEPNVEEMNSLYKACGPAFMLKVYLRTVYVERRLVFNPIFIGYLISSAI